MCYLHERENGSVHVYVCVVQREVKWRTHKFLSAADSQVTHFFSHKAHHGINNSLQRRENPFIRKMIQPIK